MPVNTYRTADLSSSAFLRARGYQIKDIRWTPGNPHSDRMPREPHPGGASAWASGTLTPSPSALSLLTGCIKPGGMAVSLAADVIACVRFNNFVRLEETTSSIAATLGMSGWLILAQQGLAPCQKR
jgi:hypothetical protein